MTVNTPIKIADNDVAPQVSRWSRKAGAVTSISGVVLVFSTFLVWGQDSGLISAYARRDDRDLPGATFSGMAAEGGSWFGIVTLLLGVLAILVGIRLLLGKRVSWSRLLGTESAIVLGLSAVTVPTAYLVLQPFDRVVGYSTGSGVYAAILAGAGILAGAAIGAAGTRFIPTHETPRPPTRLVAGVAIGLIVLVVSVFSSWIYDERVETLDDLAALVRELVEQGTNPAVAAAQVAQLAEVSAGARSTDGLDGTGPQLGILVLIVGGIVAVLAAYRALRSDAASEHTRWLLDVVLLGLGVAGSGVAVSWMLSIVRLAERQFVPGVGSFFVVAGSLLIIYSTTPYLRTFLLAPPIN